MTDTERLDWLEKTKTGVGYNVECSAWGVDHEAPFCDTIREAIDAAISQNQEIIAEETRHEDEQAKRSGLHWTHGASIGTERT